MRFRKLVGDATRLGFAARDALRTAVALDASGEIVSGMSNTTSGVTTGATIPNTTISAPNANATGYTPTGSEAPTTNMTGYTGEDEWSPEARAAAAKARTSPKRGSFPSSSVSTKPVKGPSSHFWGGTHEYGTSQTQPTPVKVRAQR